jgi:8-oxo-dGTP diphosphatase
LNEEFGIQAEIGDYFCSSFFEHRDATWEMRAYFVQSFTGEIELREHQEVRWVSIEELSGYDMPDADKPIVEKLLKEFYRK